jgi:hypothetical protein
MGYSQSKEQSKEDEISAGFMAKHEEVEARVTNYSILVIALVSVAALALGYALSRVCNRKAKNWIRRQVVTGNQGPPTQQGHTQAAAGYV